MELPLRFITNSIYLRSVYLEELYARQRTCGGKLQKIYFLSFVGQPSKVFFLNAARAESENSAQNLFF